MENTLENKAKLFAQYWGQKILKNTKQPDIKWLNNSCHTTVAMEYLKLKPLSSITDEEIKILCNFIGLVNINIVRDPDGYIFIKDESYHILIDKGSITMYYRGKCCYDDDIAINDILRSFGIARDWMNISVEKQIEYGWIKLVN